MTKAVVVTLIYMLLPPRPATARPVRVVYFELAPHAYMEKSRPSGAAIEYLKLVMKEMKRSYEIHQIPLARIVQNPEGDVVLFLGKSPEREKIFIFNSSPLLQMQGVLAIHKDTVWKLVSYKDLEHKTIGVWADGYLSVELSSSNAKLIRFFGNSVIARGLEVVKAKRIDAFYCPDGEAIKHILQENPELAKSIRILVLPEPPTGLYPAFARTTNERFRKDFSEALERVQKKKSYINFLNTYSK